MTKVTLEKIAEELKKADSVLIFCHNRPDGDTLSSAFSLKIALERLGKTAAVTCADPIPKKYAASGYFDDGLTADCPPAYSVHIAVDCASDRMIGSKAGLFFKNKKTLSVDHHVSNTLYADYNAVIDEAANAVNIYNLIKILGVEIDKRLASTIYLGICTDTGNFAQSNTDARAFEVASELVALGAEPAEIYDAMFMNQSEARARLYASVISKMQLFENGKIGVITITLEDLNKYGLDQSDTEGFISFPMSVGSVEVGISILQKGKENYKISFRSKKSTDVNAVASSFGGGGHVRASGAMLSGAYEDVLDKLIYTVKLYME